MRKPRVLAGILGAIAIGVAVLAGIGTGSTTPSMSDDQLRQRLLSCNTGSEVDACDSILQALASDQASRIHILGQLDRVFARGGTLRVSCHNAYHAIGDEIEPGDDDLAAYGEYLTKCGNGLVHGMVETVDLSGGVARAAEVVTATCTSLALLPASLQSQINIVGDCWHPIGHGIATQLSDTTKAMQVCYLATPDENTRIECVAAVLMSTENLKVGPELDRLPSDSETDTSYFGAMASYCKQLGVSVAAVRPGDGPDRATEQACTVQYAAQLFNAQAPNAGEYLMHCRSFGGDFDIRCRREAVSAAALHLVGGTTTFPRVLDSICVPYGDPQTCVEQIAAKLARDYARTPAAIMLLLQPNLVTSVDDVKRIESAAAGKVAVR